MNQSIDVLDDQEAPVSPLFGVRSRYSLYAVLVGAHK